VKKSTVPCDKAEGIPIINTKTATFQTIFFLSDFFSSTKYETGTSSNETVDVRAAIDNNIKNNPPTILPPDICANNLGNTMNTSAGPEAGFSPMANKAGNTTNPAKIAIKHRKLRYILCSKIYLYLLEDSFQGYHKTKSET